jgi:diguanylate cyclase (GGDEF)-like protein
MAALVHPFLIALLALTVGWVPASALLLRRAHAGRCKHRAAAQALQSQLQVQLFRGARRDALTALPCRPAFLETLAARLAHGRRAALLVIDLDHFGNVNIIHGDTAGDEVLCVVADRLRALAGLGNHAARLDGDGFALLLEEADSLEDLDAACDRILHSLTAPYPAAGQLIDLRLRIGVARAPDHGEGAATLLRAAHMALDHARAAGGSRWCAAGADLAGALGRGHKLRGQLRRAIAEGQVIPWYQPIVRLPGGDIESFEVLARWHHPEHGLLTPDRFVPLAEEMGLAGQLSMALLRQVSLDCAAWPETCRFAFNVSAGQVRELIGFLNTQPGEWQRRVDLSRLDVEITECALMTDRAMARELIDTLHEHGARAGLDNFGSGVSNFSFLRDMPFDSIKIGKVFVQTMLADPRAEACVLSMLWLGHGLDVDVVADGVEDAGTAERLADLGCTLAQGFFYARPVPADEVAPLFAAKGRLGGGARTADAAPRTTFAPAMMRPLSSPEPAASRG